MKSVKLTVKGHPAVDGGGVHLTRVLSLRNTRDFDPFLMLDSFDSTNPQDYVKGFPMHPHRGIETVTYLRQGNMRHTDSLGNVGVIYDGDCQWMTAGEGILHEEILEPAKRMLGLQLWLNLPKKHKFAPAAYNDLLAKDIPLLTKEGYHVRIISGELEDSTGFKPKYVPASIREYDILKDTEITLTLNSDNTVFLFTLLGEVEIDSQTYDEKTAILLNPVKEVTLKALTDVILIYFEGTPLREPIAWGGPIVMNSETELQQAFDELRRGTFLRHEKK